MKFGKLCVIISVSLAVLILSIYLISLWTAHKELAKQLCGYQEYEKGFQMYSGIPEHPAYYVDHTPKGKVVYAFSGLSRLKSMDNSREATKEELTRRFIGNKVWFVYDDSAESKVQIQDFKDHNFWLKYKFSGMTFKCE